MPLAIYTSAAWAANGGITPAGGASVEVRSETGSETAGQLVSLSSDRDGANGLNNPFTADAQGRFAFFVAGGAYRVTVTDSDGNSHTLRYQAIGTAGEMDTEDVIALANEGVFDSTADGIAATTDGAFFWVPDSPDEVILYTNVAGSAEEQLRIPTSVFVREVRQDAEDARDAAQSAGNLFSDTAAGLAATNDGDYFSVVGASAFELYLNDAGSAVLQFTYGGPQGTAPGEIPTNADLPNSSSVGTEPGQIPTNAGLPNSSAVGNEPNQLVKYEDDGTGGPRLPAADGGQLTGIAEPGDYKFVQEDLTGAAIPDPDLWIKLEAGLTDAGEYNEGKLTNESVTGSAPLVEATATISDPESPMDGQTVHLLETERRFLRPGDGGLLEEAQANAITQFRTNPYDDRALSSAISDVPDNGSWSSYKSTGNGASGSNGGWIEMRKNGLETRPRAIGVAVYMRIK